MSLKKMASKRQHMLLQNVYISFSVNGAFTVQVTHAVGTNTPPYHDRPWNFTVVTIWMVFFFFGTENTMSIIPITNLKS